MAPSTKIAAVALSALRYASAFQPAAPTFRTASSGSLRMADAATATVMKASDNDFEDFSTKVSALLNFNCN